MVSTQTTTGPVRSVTYRSKVHMSNMQQQTPQQQQPHINTHCTPHFFSGCVLPARPSLNANGECCDVEVGAWACLSVFLFSLSIYLSIYLSVSLFFVFVCTSLCVNVVVSCLLSMSMFITYSFLFVPACLVECVSASACFLSFVSCLSFFPSVLCLHFELTTYHVV